MGISLRTSTVIYETRVEPSFHATKRRARYGCKATSASSAVTVKAAQATARGLSTKLLSKEPWPSKCANVNGYVVMRHANPEQLLKRLGTMPFTARCLCYSCASTLPTSDTLGLGPVFAQLYHNNVLE